MSKTLTIKAMKKLTDSLFAGSFIRALSIQAVFMTALIVSSKAQSPAFLPLLQQSTNAFPVNDERIHSKTLLNFSQSFKHASNVRWFSQGKRNLVKFSSNDVKCQALFSKRGNLLYTIRYGVEKHLPSFIKTKVKFGYFDYTIRSVIQINEANREIWITQIENDRYLVTLRIEGNQLKEADKTIKSS